MNVMSLSCLFPCPLSLWITLFSGQSAPVSIVIAILQSLTNEAFEKNKRSATDLKSTVTWRTCMWQRREKKKGGERGRRGYMTGYCAKKMSFKTQSLFMLLVFLHHSQCIHGPLICVNNTRNVTPTKRSVYIPIPFLHLACVLFGTIIITSIK